MIKPILIVTAVLGAGLTALAQESTPPAAGASAQMVIPVQASRQVNPVKPTTESIAAAKRTYGYDCAMCHGETGDGKGDTAADMKVLMKDLRDPETLKGLTDGEIYYIIVNGKGKMPPEGERAKPDRLWNLVVYLRSMSDPSVLPVDKPEKPEKIEKPRKAAK